MNDFQKPFACPAQGCNMSFANEDHLTVHKKKHDMMLNLNSAARNSAFIVDQTPTPTRFIRHCEEVGLFQDLQSDNPFEETFRRAVESGKPETSPSVSQVSTSETTSASESTSSVVCQKKRGKSKQPNNEKLIIPMTESLAQSTSNLSVNAEKLTFIDAPVIQSTHNISDEITVKEENKPPVASLVNNREKKQNSKATSAKRKSVNIDSNRKKDILERNRASSMRARAKRKAWVEELQNSLKNANEANTKLQAQVKNLQSEVENLKALLLVHKDCPINKDVGKGGCNIPTVKRIQINQSQPSILSVSKNPVILPKLDVSLQSHRAKGITQVQPITSIGVVTPLISNLGTVGTNSQNVHPAQLILQNVCLLNSNAQLQNDIPKTLGS